MKKTTALLVMALSIMPAMAPSVVMAAGAGNGDAHGVSRGVGDRNSQGKYWDGYQWRTAKWWRAHQGKHLGERNQHGEYWDGGRWSPKAPAAAKARPQGNAGDPKNQGHAAGTEGKTLPGGDNRQQSQNGATEQPRKAPQQ
ncbi:DUF2502 domain-containing protein [Sodalis sp. RH21]|uniref:DUF2502 domain-containing protein n=1 Tax=unclassified Sodalis (in: enterobacteria) TaxID=2636512 RepID=UPI0039B5B61D